MTLQNTEKNTKRALALVVMFALGFASAELLNRLRGNVWHTHEIPQGECIIEEQEPVEVAVNKLYV
jgi:hypothetical protein